MAESSGGVLNSPHSLLCATQEDEGRTCRMSSIRLVDGDFMNVLGLASTRILTHFSLIFGVGESLSLSLPPPDSGRGNRQQANP